jgi:hypothetical protein
MHSLAKYLNAISKRGDHYGGHGGILDLLCWSGKQNTQEITLEDATRFYENPDQPYLITTAEKADEKDTSK